VKLRRHRRLVAVLLALGLTGAQWMFGGHGGSACAVTGCPTGETAR